MLFDTVVNARDSQFAGGIKSVNSPEDNTVALQAALNTQKNVFIPDGNYKIAPGLLFTRIGQQLLGPGTPRATLLCCGDGMFVNSNGYHNVKVSGLRFQGRSAEGVLCNSGYAINLDGVPQFGSVPQQSGRVAVEDVEIFHMPGGVFIRDMNTTHLDRVFMAGMRGIGVRVQSFDLNQRVDIVSLYRVTYSADVAARPSGYCEGLSVDGCVHTIILNEFRAVNPSRGISIWNGLNLPFGQHAAFLFGRGVEIDFPEFEGICVTHCDRVRFTDLYCHGSRTGNGIAVLHGVNDFKIMGGNVTGHKGSGVLFGGQKMDLIGVEFEANNQFGGYPHINLTPDVQHVSLVGGGTDASGVYGVVRNSATTNVHFAAWRGAGSNGAKNF